MDFVRSFLFNIAFLLALVSVSLSSSMALAVDDDYSISENYDVSVDKNDYDTLGQYRCDLSVVFKSDKWFDDARRANQWCGGFGEFSRFCQVFDRSGRYFSSFSYSRNFFYAGQHSLLRSRGQVFGRYYDFLTDNRLYRNSIIAETRFGRDCSR